MPVIINDLEIVSETDSQPVQPSEADVKAHKPNVLPQEIDTIIKRVNKKMIRIRAH